MVRTFIIGVSLLATSVSAQTPLSPPPASLALGTAIAAKMVPDGTYERLMAGDMQKMMAGMTNQVGSMPLAPFLKAAGLSESDIAKLGKTTFKQIMDILDPAYEQRTQLMMPVMMSEMGKIMTRFEPMMREGLAQAYAAKFTPAQLQDISRFLSTPSGSAFASQNITIATHPAVMQRMQAFMPQLMTAMPEIMGKAYAATNHLPKPKTPRTLTEADRKKLSELLGSEPDKLKADPAGDDGMSSECR